MTTWPIVRSSTSLETSSNNRLNREAVAAKTFQELKQTTIINDTEKPIDDDWLTQFWNLAATKSNDEVQTILSRILAKEILQPSSVSPNTLMLLSVLTSDIGIMFQKFCNISISIRGQLLCDCTKYRAIHQLPALG